MLTNDYYYKGEEMKVFISWSGHKSFEVAKVLKEWIPLVIQGIEPYFSSEDIDKGARWSTDIAKELETASFGILCVTKDNLESQWLNFEAGALSKAIDKAKVCPFLFDLKPSDISNSPILQFQMTNIDQDDMLKLFRSMNDCLGDKGLDESRLEKSFKTFWPKIDVALKSIEDNTTYEDNTNEDSPSLQETMLEEMLELLRTQQLLLRNPESLFPPKYLEEVLNHSRIRDINLFQYINSLVDSGLLDNHRMVEWELINILDKIISQKQKFVDESEQIEIMELYKVARDYIDLNNTILRQLRLRKGIRLSKE